MRMKTGTWVKRAQLLVALAVVECSGDTTAPVDPRPNAAAYDRFWADFDGTYSYFQYKNIDWTVGRSDFRERAAAATTDSALIEVLRDAVRPLRDVHVWFRRPNGTTLPSYTPSRPPNWNTQNWQSYRSKIAWRSVTTAWGWGRLDDVGYIMISGWNSSIVSADLDAALEQLRDTRALIIDVRPNGGGSDAIALGLAGRFTTRTVRFGAVRFRSGPAHSDFGPWMDRTLSPRGAWQYTKPVYLLVGPMCFSSNETFIAALGELPQVIVGGDVTGGSSGNPREFDLIVGGRNTGWKYAVPRWIEALADGTVVEWNGIRPDVIVPFEASLVAAGRDPVLEWAFQRTGVALTP
jgi:C-terminal processing protease CtpA/Prc